MKTRFLVVLAALISPWAATAQDEDVPEITANTAPFVYDAFAAEPKGLGYIAGLTSQDFANAPDEFVAWDHLQRMLPALQRKLKEAKETPLWMLKVGTTIARYDFNKMAFPTGLGESTFVPVGRSTYAVRFENVRNLGFIPVPIDDVRKFSTQLRQSRSGTLLLTGSIAKAAVEELNGKSMLVLTMRVSEIAIQLPSEEVLASTKL